MSDKRVHWLIVGLAVIVGAAGALFAVAVLNRGGSSAAYAQAPGEAAGSANYVLALLGNTANDATPVVLIDTKSQTLLVYEYMVSRHTLFLRVARNYSGDRELVDNTFFTGDSYTPQGQSVNEIRKLVSGSRR